MSDQLNALNEALAQAKAAAANTAVAPVEGGGNVVAMSAPVQPGRAISMREMVAESGMSVDHYMKVDKPGFTIGKDTTTYLKEIEVEFRLDAAKPFYGVRYGNPAKYLRSYDRMTESRTKRPWADVVAEAGRQDPRCTGDYRAVDIPFVAVNTITASDGKTTLAEKGDTLGWTSSVTNWKRWQAFIEPFLRMMDAGQIGEDALVRGKILHVQEKNGQHVWGAVDFGDFTIVDAGSAQAA